MYKSRITQVLVIAMMLVLVGSMVAMAADTIKICHLAPLTGGSAFQGQILVNAAKLAVEEINAAGGINGMLIEYIPIDETSSSSSGIEAVRKAIAEDPVVVIGPNRSGTILAAENLWREAKIPFLVDGTNADITKRGNPYTFRMQVESTYWAPLLIRTALEYYGVEKPAVIYGLNDYSKDLWNATKAALDEQGIKPVTVQTFNDGDRDFTAQLLKVRAAGADALFCFGYETEQGIILRQRSELGLQDLRIFGERGCASPAVSDLAGLENVEGVITTTNFCTGDPDPVKQEFVRKWNETYNVAMSPTHVCHYDTIHILADIIGRVGTDREAIREELANLDFQAPLGYYRADKYGNLSHTMYSQVFENGEWKILLMEDYSQLSNTASVSFSKIMLEVCR